MKYCNHLLAVNMPGVARRGSWCVWLSKMIGIAQLGG